MHQYDELRGYETKDLWGSFHSHFTELWLEQTVLIWMVCPTNGLQSFITQGMPVDLVPRGFAGDTSHSWLRMHWLNCLTVSPFPAIQLIEGDPTKLVM